MRKRGKRKAHTINPMATWVAIQGASKITRTDAIRFSLNLGASIEAVCRGTGLKGDWQVIFAAVNILEELIRMRVAQDTDGAIHSMQDSIASIMDRQRDTGTRALYADEVGLLRELAATYTDVLCEVTHKELFQAEERSAQRIKQVLSSPRPDVRIVRPV